MKLPLIALVVFALWAGTANAHDHYDRMSYAQLAVAGKKEVARGGTYSVRYGDCSSRLKRISYELVQRVFAPYGSAAIRWAQYIVSRESGHCPGAVNTTYSSWREQAQCIAQLIPRYHSWVNYTRCKTDPAYSVQVFRKLSNGGRSTGPWSTY